MYIKFLEDKKLGQFELEHENNKFTGSIIEPKDRTCLININQEVPENCINFIMLIGISRAPSSLLFKVKDDHIKVVNHLSKIGGTYIHNEKTEYKHFLFSLKENKSSVVNIIQDYKYNYKITISALYYLLRSEKNCFLIDTLNIDRFIIFREKTCEIGIIYNADEEVVVFSNTSFTKKIREFYEKK